MQQKMKKIAIFTEGQSEQIFVRHFLTQVIGWEKISFECWKLYANRMDPAPFKYAGEKAEIHFFILNVTNDERLLSAVNDREKRFIQKGYEKIIALRDMHSQKYSKRSGGVIDEGITRIFIENANMTIKNMSNPSRIKMHFAIMELEAWFLGMYNMFERLNPALSIDYIEGELGFNLSVIDPQTEFFKPADIVGNILQLIDWQYKKSEHDIESICSQINTNDLCDAFKNGRCSSFRDFYEEMSN